MPTALRWFALGALSPLLACGPAEPPPVQGAGGEPLDLISDAVHHSGTPGFYFLPPLAPHVKYGPVASLGLSPVVTVDELGGRGTVATFLRGAAALEDRVMQTGQFYTAVWLTKRSGVEPKYVYRIRVSVGGFELGFADAQVVAGANGVVEALRSPGTREIIPLLANSALPIKFRIEPDALKCVGVSCVASDQYHVAGTCDPATGICSNPPAPDGTPCSDGQVCTSGRCLEPTGTFAEFVVPTAFLFTPDIAAGPDGALWYTGSSDMMTAKIGRITTSGIVTEFTVPGGGPAAGGITAGSDGALWFTGPANAIGRITTSGAVTGFPIPTSYVLLGVASGPDGAVWFTEFDRIGRITTSGVITDFPIPTAPSAPQAIAAGPDGALWFTEFDGNKIGRITTSGVVTEFPLPTAASSPRGIAAGPDGNLWFAEYGGNRIGRITTNGAITEFAITTPDCGPYDIAAGPDGNLWFTESRCNKIGRITTSGVVTEFLVPTPDSGPRGIVAGPDGHLWFAEFYTGKVGRIAP